MKNPYRSMATQYSYAPPGKEATQDARPVQRRDGDEVEDSEDDVDLHHQEEQDRTPTSRTAPGVGHDEGSARRRLRITAKMTARMKFVAGPATPTTAMPALPVLEVVRRDGDRLRPAEDEPPRTGSVMKNISGADRVQMADRVEAQPAPRLGRRVTQPVRHQPMRHLVQRHRDERGSGPESQKSIQSMFMRSSPPCAGPRRARRSVL